MFQTFDFPLWKAEHIYLSFIYCLFVHTMVVNVVQSLLFWTLLYVKIM